MISKRREKGGVRVIFSLPGHEPAGSVTLVGDFNGWDRAANPLRARPNGRRSTSVVLPAGAVAEFRYVGEDGAWFDDEQAEGWRDNPHGGRNGLVTT
ncbi:MAG: isoamylase early set domain-containing protein [Acidimicrobiales bacterium]